MDDIQYLEDQFTVKKRAISNVSTNGSVRRLFFRCNCVDLETIRFVLRYFKRVKPHSPTLCMFLDDEVDCLLFNILTFEEIGVYLMLKSMYKEDFDWDMFHQYCKVVPRKGVVVADKEIKRFYMCGATIKTTKQISKLFFSSLDLMHGNSLADVAFPNKNHLIQQAQKRVLKVLKGEERLRYVRSVFFKSNYHYETFVCEHVLNGMIASIETANKRKFDVMEKVCVETTISSSSVSYKEPRDVAIPNKMHEEIERYNIERNLNYKTSLKGYSIVFRILKLMGYAKKQPDVEGLKRLCNIVEEKYSSNIFKIFDLEALSLNNFVAHISNQYLETFGIPDGNKILWVENVPVISTVRKILAYESTFCMVQLKALDNSVRLLQRRRVRVNERYIACIFSEKLVIQTQTNDNLKWLKVVCAISLIYLILRYITV